jgi:hypothetical protein
MRQASSKTLSTACRFSYKGPNCHFLLTTVSTSANTWARAFANMILLFRHATSERTSRMHGLSLGCKLRRNSLVAQNNTDNKHGCKEKCGQWRTWTARSFSGHNSNGFYSSTTHLYTPRHPYYLLIWINASDWRTQMGPCPRHGSVQIPCDHSVHNN